MEVSGRREDFIQSVLGASEEENEFHCDPCEHDGHHLPAEGFCVDCQEYLCSACYKVHRRPAVWRHHRLQDKQSMPKVKPVSRVKDVCTEICRKHDKIIEYFCNSHESFGCSACFTTQHRACEKVDFIPEVAATFGTSKELKELQSKLTELLTKSERNKSEINKTSKAVVLQAERAKMQVKRLRSNIAKLFDQLEKKIDESIDELKTDDENKMAELASKMDVISQELQHHVTDIESRLHEKNMCHLFMVAKRIQEPLNNLIEDVINVGDSCKIQRYQFTPDPTIVEMIGKVESLGILDIKNRHARVPKFENDINVKAESDEKKCVITGIALLSEQLLVVTDKSNESVKLIDTVNNCVKSIYKLEGHLIFPFDVTKVHVTQIAVTYPYKRKIRFLEISEYGSMVLQRYINANGKCYGIECMGDSLIVSFIRPPAVKILTMTGTVIRTLNLVGNLQYTHYVAVNSKQKLVYVSNWASSGSGSVICVTNEGEKKALFEDNNLDGPHGASVDTHEIVYVCGQYSCNVVQLSDDCTMIQGLLNKDDGLNYPLCLALTRKNDKLYIGMEGDTIKVFQLF